MDAAWSFETRCHNPDDHNMNLHRRKGKVVPVKYHDMQTYWDSGGVAPSMFNLGTRWR